MAFGVDDYDPIRPGMIRSAATVVPHVMQLLKPKTVVDVGCGQGVWLAEFARHGCEVFGYDGHDGSRLDIPDTRYQHVDLDTVPAIEGRFDLALCLEVAEHLHQNRAEWLIRALTGLSDMVLFSAAIPGQGGLGHINEQWPDYWNRFFHDLGYTMSGSFRFEFWHSVPDHIEPWYAQNLMLAIKSDIIDSLDLGLQDYFDGLGSRPWPVVHPHYWGAR